MGTVWRGFHYFVVIVIVVVVAIHSLTRVIPNFALLSLFRNKAGKRHNTGHKGRARVNRLSASAPITEKSIEKRMRRLIAA